MYDLEAVLTDQRLAREIGGTNGWDIDLATGETADYGLSANYDTKRVVVSLPHEIERFVDDEDLTWIAFGAARAMMAERYGSFFADVRLHPVFALHEEKSGKPDENAQAIEDLARGTLDVLTLLQMNNPDRAKWFAQFSERRLLDLEDSTFNAVLGGAGARPEDITLVHARNAAIVKKLRLNSLNGLVTATKHKITDRCTSGPQLLKADTLARVWSTLRPLPPHSDEALRAFETAVSDQAEILRLDIKPKIVEMEDGQQYWFFDPIASPH